MNRFVLAAILPFAAPAFAGNVAPVFDEPTLAPIVVEPVYDWSGAYVGAQVNYGTIQSDGLASADGDGFLVGLRAGYDLDLGRAVVGGLVQYDTGSIELGATGAEVEDILRVGGRVGYDLGRALFYGAAGYTQADTNVVGNMDGYFLGVGTEMFVTDSVTVGIETLYHDFGDLDGAPGVDAEAATVGLNLNYRF